MAMSFVIRKATVGPRTLGSVTSPRFLSESIYTNHVHSGCFAISEQSFSTVGDSKKQADKELSKVLKSKIKLAKLLYSDLQVPKAPAGSVRNYRRYPGLFSIMLFTRKFEGEKIVVEVIEPCNPEDKNVNSDSSDDDTDDESSSTNASDEEEPKERSISEPYCLFTVKITTENGHVLRELHCRANVDSITIETIDIRESKYIKGSTILVSGQCYDVEYIWKKYLEIRGIDNSFGELLLDYMIKKSRRDRVFFWEKFRKFVKE